MKSYTLTEPAMMQMLADKILELQQRIHRAITAAEQPHYGDTDTKIDNYQEAISILRGEIE